MDHLVDAIFYASAAIGQAQGDQLFGQARHRPALLAGLLEKIGPQSLGEV
jgi:hypothetical protein